MDATERARPLRIVLAIAFAGLGMHAAISGFGIGGEGVDAFAQTWLYDGLIVTSAALCLLRARLVSAERTAWLALGLGLTAWSAGEIHYSIALAGLEEPPYPSLSDALYLAFYPASYAALVLLVKARMRELQLSLWLDGMVAGLAVAAFGAMFLVDPILSSTDGSTLTVLTDLAYPLGDVLLLALVAAGFALFGWQPGRAWLFIGAGLVATAVADGLLLYQTAAGSYVQGTILDTLWPASTLLVAYAAWQQPRAGAAAPLRGWRTLMIPTLFALAALGLLVVGDSGATPDRVAVALAAGALLAMIVRMALTYWENMRMLEGSRREALTDALTGLGNRRRLVEELAHAVNGASDSEPRLLVVFDLDGFKRYNDTFGHPAGDALLGRLGRNLEAAIEPYGSAYRLGGDEFCALVSMDSPGSKTIVAAATAALAERGKGFEVRASYGTVVIPHETADPALALQIADQRLYAGKNERRSSSASQQLRDVLLQALHERVPELKDHLADVAGMAIAVGRRLGLLPEELDVVARAAELHDVGKVAVPDAILQKPGPLDETELSFIHQHTITGERILNAAPALLPVAKQVRASHERWDGMGYPDGLEGEAIPLGARIVAACDAFHAMTSTRPYREAMSTREAIAELRRCAGTHFDPRVVDALCEELTNSSSAPHAIASDGDRLNGAGAPTAADGAFGGVELSD